MSKDFGQAADTAIFAVIAPEQGKNRERNFFFPVIGHFVGYISIFNQSFIRGFRCYSITGKRKRGTAKHSGDNSERLGG